MSPILFSKSSNFSELSHLSQKELNEMLPPQPGTFEDREDLIKYVRDFGASQGYVVTIKKSRKDRRVILGCDRGGVYRNRRKIDESKRKRKASSRLINCPFEAIGKKEDDVWVLAIKNGEHNHEALKDMSEHPYSRRFTEEEVRKIKVMTEAGIKPRQVLKALKQSNPELQSTPRHLYNLKAKIRQGTVSEKSFNSWRPNRSVPVNTSTSNPEGTLTQNNQLLKVPNFVGGKFVDSHASSVIDVINPATQEVVSQVPTSTYEEFKAAVSSAKQAFPLWKNTPITTRQRIMFKLQELIYRDIDKLAMNMTMEQGKTSKGAKGDVLRGLEVVEHACGVGNLQMGEFVPNSSNGIDTYCIREPLGVCAGICPFNFPAMTPLWMFPIAVTCGNTFVLKPCENNPGASLMLASLATEAGLPDGVLNVVHGAHDIVNYICDDDDIKAISFVGSNAAGMHVYAREASRGKRVQSNVGGKNLAIIMPDASVDTTLNALVAAGFGDAGVAISTAIFVRGSIPWERELVDRAKSLKVNVGTDPNADLGPVISKEVPGYENGSFVGPTILSDITTNMDCYKEEIFGPILLCMQVDSLEEAIMIVNRNRYVNGASIFTTSGIAARKFQNEVDAGLVGINVSVPVPLPFSSFSGSKASFSGKSGVQFYTQIKTVAQQWKDLSSLVLPLAVPPPSEKDMTGRAACSALPSSSDRDSASQRGSPSMHSESETDSPSHGVSLPVTSSEADLPNPGVSSVSSTADRDLPSQGVYLPPTSERELSNGEMSLALPPTTDRDLPSQGVSITSTQISERMYMPQASRWNETSHPTSQRNDTLPPTSERIHTATSQRNDNTTLASQRADINMALTSERVYIPASHDTMGSMSHRNDSMAATSHRVDANVHPSSERVYMLTSHLGDSMTQTLQRSDTMFTTSERLYMLATSHRSDHIGLTTQRNDIALHSTSERIYMSAASQRNDNLTAASQPTDSMPSTSERMYMSSIVQRNAAMPPTSERLYMHGTSPRLYPQNPIISMEEFPSQGPSVSLPSSQRI
ncbi:uncharacterized protein LOC133806588 isoform X2 [Humulus lupulus]|uniref:uncharacterized protein LOC133806588 isoform X2 n=1 Tax=Humulus lupulus TaxID=3486 RepID=UPI002B404564|nr:uncharacterized protein LOC133806588 isoform X2 [Humulus lupulus]